MRMKIAGVKDVIELKDPIVKIVVDASPILLTIIDETSSILSF